MHDVPASERTDKHSAVLPPCFFHDRLGCDGGRFSMGDNPERSHKTFRRVSSPQFLLLARILVPIYIAWNSTYAGTTYSTVL